MSYTNQTANYGLPQYTADDKPTYLGDFNKAMLDIDTAIKANENIAQASQTLAQNANNSASEALSTANTASSSATNAGVKADNAYALAESAKADATQATTDATDAKTIANSANQTATSANATATSAQTTATNANNTATSAQTTAQAVQTALAQFENKFNISEFTSIPNSAITSTNGTTDIVLNVATNTEKSIGKIYGAGYVTPSRTDDLIISFSTNIHPAEKITIASAGYISDNANTSPINMEINTDGTIKLNMHSWQTGIQRILLFPCLYFFKSFNDVIIDE